MIRKWPLMLLAGLALSGVVYAETFSAIEQGALCQLSREKALNAAVQSGVVSKKHYSQDYEAYYFPVKPTQVFGGKLLAVISDSTDTTNGKHIGCCADNTFAVLVKGADNAQLAKLVPQDGRNPDVPGAMITRGNDAYGLEVLKKAMSYKEGKIVPREFAGMDSKDVVQVRCKPE